MKDHYHPYSLNPNWQAILQTITTEHAFRLAMVGQFQRRLNMAVWN